MTVFRSRRRRVMSIFCLKHQLHLCLSQSIEQITAYFPDLPVDHLNGEKYSYLTIILHKLSDHLSEQTPVTHPAWREQEIKRRLCSRRCELDASLAEQIRLTHQGARVIALTTVLRQDRLEKEKRKKRADVRQCIAKKVNTKFDGFFW